MSTNSVTVVFVLLTVVRGLERMNFRGYNFTSIVFLAKVCNFTEQISKADFASFWYNRFANDFDKCTLGNVVFHPPQNIIVEVYIPCLFRSSYTNQTINNTVINPEDKYDNIYHWMNYVLTNTPVVNMDSYRHKLLVLPHDMDAGFYALGYIDCRTNSDNKECFTWYNNMNLPSNVFLHELGHNFGLGHAKTLPNNEYGDATCVMGSSTIDAMGCYNAPHRFILNWDEPIGVLDKNNDKYDDNVTLSSNGMFVIVGNDTFIEAVEYNNSLTIKIHVLNQDVSTDYLCLLQTTNQYCEVRNSLIVQVIGATKDLIVFHVCSHEKRNKHTCIQDYVINDTSVLTGIGNEFLNNISDNIHNNLTHAVSIYHNLTQVKSYGFSWAITRSLLVRNLITLIGLFVMLMT